MSTYPLNHSSRAELDIELNIVEGELPDDLSGHFFVVGPCGTVNHPAPAPRHWPDGSTCQAHGSPAINGDGMLYRFDFNANRSVSLKSRLLKTPDYLADEATKQGSSYFEEGFCFDNIGLSRTHIDLGTRNQLNTALNLIQLDEKSPMMLTANFDAGRPFLVDAAKMEVISAIGKQQEWLQALPKEMEQVFPLTYSTAHPAFDPHTREFYSVCYQKSISTLMFSNRLDRGVLMAGKFVNEEVEKFTAWLTGTEYSLHDMANAIRRFIPWLNEKHAQGHKEEFAEHFELQHSSLLNSELRVMRWTGDKLNSWLVIDSEEGLPITLTQTMHQMALCEDYLVLGDCTLKFAMDMLQSLPFGDNDGLNALLRKLTANTIKPNTPIYIIRRKDLIKDQERVIAHRTVLPIETIHFVLNYRNPGGVITLHGSHNSAACGGEWIRPYDKRKTDGEPMPEERYGLMSASGLDIGSLGKHEIDGSSGEILQSWYCSEKGFHQEVPHPFTAAHSWGLGLFAHRNMVHHDAIEDEVRHIYHQFYGLDANDLTEFIYDLYENYNREGRQIQSEEILEYYRQGIPQSIARLDTTQMKLADHYNFSTSEAMRSFDFITRPGDPPQGLDPQMHGYILCLVLKQEEGEEEYRRLLYIFDAADLAAGPLCKLGHDEMAWGFTVHSCCAPQVTEAECSYKVDAREDCEWVLSKFPREEKKQRLRDFLEKEVYPKL